MSRHWIVQIVDWAKLPGGSGLDIPPGTPAIEAWRRVLEVTGVSEDRLAEAVASSFRLAVADLDAADPVASRLLPASIARQFNVYPLRLEDRGLVVATADPVNHTAEQEVGFASGRVPIMRIAPPSRIAKAIEATYAPDRAVADLLGAHARGEDAVILEEEATPEAELFTALVDEGNSGPIVRLANMILEDAVRKGASDIHLQPTATGGVVRFRIDGVLRTAITVPLGVLIQVVSRIKIMSRLDISDRLRPQDGRSRIRIDGRRFDLRVSTVPVQGGEKAVIRILDPEKSGELDDAGLPPPEVKRLRQALKGRDGIIVVTGPTGSGKTTTMYAALREIATEDVNIMTVEDPVEYELAGLTQIQVDTVTGITFHTALKAILRQDPDVIFVGEIRDPPTAQMAAQASLTGHLVLATIHANDAVGAVRRFEDLGLDPGTIADTLRASMAQRLVRALCDNCARPPEGPLDPLPARLSDALGVRPARVAKGCDVCGHSGYRGRRPVVEILVPSAEFLEMASNGATHLDLTRRARMDGMRTMLECGLGFVEDGITTLEEVARVVGKDTLLPLAGGSTAGSGTAASRPPSAPTPETTPPETALPDPAPSDPAPPDPRTAPTAAPGGAPARGASPGRAALRPLRAGDRPGAPSALVVEDEEETLLLVRAILESHGWLVEEAPTATIALEKLATPGLALVVLDLNLPDMDGVEVLKAAQRRPSTAVVPVVVLTGRGDDATERQMLVEGAADFIRKPVDPAIFVARVQAAVRRRTG